jgi:hypothetical protein
MFSSWRPSRISSLIPLSPLRLAVSVKSRGVLLAVLCLMALPVQAQWAVRTAGDGETVGDINDAEYFLSHPLTYPTVGTDAPTIINYNANFPGNPNGGQDFALEATGRVNIVSGTSATVTLYVNSDDGFRLYLNGTVIGEFVGGTSGSNTTMPNVTLHDGDLLRLVYFQGSGSSFLRLRLNDDTGLFIGDAASGITIVPQSYTVTSLADDGGGALMTLREAIELNNAGPGNTDIYFASDVVGTIKLNGSPLVITKAIVLHGPNARVLTISGNGQSRVLDIQSGTATISGLTITDGHASGKNEDGAGGGIHVAAAARLELTNCEIKGNTADSSGGGLYNASSSDTESTLTNCTLSGNVANGAAGGGAIHNAGNLSLTNVTVSGNNAASATQGGGGIQNTNFIVIDSCTVANNITAAGPGGGIRTNSGTLAMGDTIVAGNTASSNPDLSGTVVFGDYNLVQNPTGAALSGTHNITGQNPLLGSLQYTGGPTATHALLAGSPAIDSGNSGQPNDQRGATRPFDDPNVVNGSGNVTDIGAVEQSAEALQSGPNFTVNAKSDAGDMIPTTCGIKVCNLRAAILAANQFADASTISFDSTVFSAATGPHTIIVNSAGSGILGLSAFELTAPITIDGPGADVLTVQRDTSNDGTMFEVKQRLIVSYGIDASIRGLTLRNGRTAEDGGALLQINGTLALENCAFSENQVVPPVSGLPSNGGAVSIRNLSGAPGLSPRFTATNCTFNGNSTAGRGGAIETVLARVTLTNCTFSGNSAQTGSGLLRPFSNDNIALVNCTIADNTAPDAGIVSNGAHVSLTNCILKTGASGANLMNTAGGSITSLGHNLSNDSSGGFLNASGDQINTDPMLVALQNNGGPTSTRALLAGSPAINAGNNASAPVFDQRYYQRSGVSDIGAFEFNGAPQPIPLVAVGSRKLHDSARPFDIDLLTFNVTVECRTGGANNDHTIVFRFLNPLVSVGNVNFTGVGSISSGAIGINPREYVVNLTGVTNAQVIHLGLTNVTDTAGNNGNTPVESVAFLLGDTNGNGAVSSSDVSQTKSQSGAATSSANFREDVDADGSINSSDVSLVKSKSGTALPSVAQTAATRAAPPR